MRIAIVGLGTMGQVHLDAWSRIMEAELVAVCGHNQEKTDRLANEYHVNAYYDLAAMLEEEMFDILDICLPTYLHKSTVLQAAQAGKHIICEKPLGLTSIEVAEMIESCKQNHVRLFPGHTLRFCPEYAATHERVIQDQLGDIGIVRMSRRNAYPRGSNDWFTDSSKSGGVILDLLIHDLDWLLWTFGEAERVTAQRVRYEEEDRRLEYAWVTIKLKNGAIAFIEGSWAHTDYSSSFEITGTKGMLSEQNRESIPLKIYTHDDDSGKPGVIVPDSTLNENPYQRQLRHFVTCLHDGVDARITPEQALQAVQLVEAAHTSIAIGQPVQISQGGS